VLASNRGPGGRFELFITLRPDNVIEFGSPNQDHLAMVNARNADSQDPFLSSDGRTLYLSQDTGGPSHPRIVFATRIDTASDFAPPNDLGEINRNGTFEDDFNLYVSDVAH
jgi:hypothetical protein